MHRVSFNDLKRMSAMNKTGNRFETLEWIKLINDEDYIVLFMIKNSGIISQSQKSIYKNKWIRIIYLIQLIIKLNLKVLIHNKDCDHKFCT